MKLYRYLSGLAPALALAALLGAGAMAPSHAQTTAPTPVVTPQPM